ncbi:amidohydrolase [Streptomyces alfalfae]|nr:amidohydrolase [Streptomyces fradiae]QUI35768.1 amidohydrolase [Streptomyces alfalfae]RXX35675.1 amidohydrolase [Streptomyces alfalfae]RZM81600.1 amidohydrolase [Streptomyces alfalfae]
MERCGEGAGERAVPLRRLRRPRLLLRGALDGGAFTVALDQKELDGDGVAAEVVFPDADAVDSRTAAPFGVGLSLSGDQDPELGMAGARAHDRWLADFVSEHPERHCYVALLPVTGEADRVVAEIHRAKESGLGALMIPAMWVDKAPYHDRRYDPVWAAAAECAMPVLTHSGAVPRHEYGDHLGIYVSEVTWWPGRPLSFLLWSGVFERHPGLRLVLTEQGSGWIPGVLDMLDYCHARLVAAARSGGTAETAESKFGAGLAEAMGKGPSEVWRDNCFVGASFMRPHEAALRDRIGLDKIMWGGDYPHDEGTHPYSREGLRTAYAGLPRDEIAAMVGGNAARVYGFDLERLETIAARGAPR